MKYEQDQIINARCLQYYKIKHFVGRVMMTQRGRNLKFLDHVIPQRSPLSSIWGKFLSILIGSQGWTTSMVCCKYFQQQMAAPVAGGVSFTHIQSRKKLANGSLRGSVSRTSQKWGQRGDQRYILSTFSRKSAFGKGLLAAHTHPLL